MFVFDVWSIAMSVLKFSCPSIYFMEALDIYGQNSDMPHFNMCSISVTLYSKVHSIRGRILFEGAFYSRVNSIRGCVLFEGTFYSRVRSIPGCLLFEGAFYSRVHSILGCVLFDGTFYLRVCSIQGCILNHYLIVTGHYQPLLWDLPNILHCGWI